MNDAGYACVSNNVVGHSVTVIRCTRERNADSHITVVYALLDELDLYCPLIVVKGTTSSLCRCGGELQHCDVGGNWKVWRILVPEHWEVPSRHDEDRAKRRAMYPHVTKEHWGDEYRQERKQLRAKLLRRANGGR